MTKLSSILPKRWQKKRTKPSHYSETNLESSALPQSRDYQSADTLLHNIKTLNLSTFKVVQCHNKLSALVISGNPSQREVEEAWEQILCEYSGYFKTRESQYLFDMAKQIGLLQWHIRYVENAISILRSLPDPEIIQELIGMGYDGNYDTKDLTAYHKQLNLVLSLCKTRVFEYDELYDEYKRLQGAVSGNSITEEQFEANVVTLSKFQGYRIDQDKTMVYEYAAIFSNYISDFEHRKKIMTPNE